MDDEKVKILQAYDKIFEASVYDKAMEKRIKKILPKAQDAFWAVIAKEFKEVKSGDFGPGELMAMEKAMETAVYRWLENNYEV